MGLTIIEKLPTGEGELISIANLPILVKPNERWEAAMVALQALVSQAGTLAEIRTDQDYEQSISALQAVKRFRRQIEEGVNPTKKQLNQAKDTVMEYIHQLDDPAAQLERALSSETARYSRWREAERRREEERLRVEAEEKRRREQREVDLHALRAEIKAAKQEVDAARHRLQEETAKEIESRLKAFETVDAFPDAFPDPLGQATLLRQAVSLARQREDARRVAAAARARGDKSTARKIEEKAKHLAPPRVEPVRSADIQADPVVVPKAELTKTKGQHVRERWVIDEILDETKVPREFCVPSTTLIQGYADRCGNVEPHLDGVTFKRVSKTVVRATQ